ncbi:MAG: hypothetical protein ACYCSI_00515 [Solirubrobacteraceae bacterium]
MGDEPLSVRSNLLDEALHHFAQAAASALSADLAAGAEIPFELASAGGARRGAGLRVYRALTAEFVRGRWPELARLDAAQNAIRALEGCHGLERYVASRIVPAEGRGGRGRAGRLGARGRAIAALQAFAEELFDEQSDFELRQERFADALRALDAASAAEGASLTVLATLHGVALVSAELPIAHGLTIAQPQAISELPEELREDPPSGVSPPRQDEPSVPLVVLYSAGDCDQEPARALARARAVLTDLLVALRLFGDGRIAFGPLAWARVDGGPFRAVGLGERVPHARRSLVVTEAQEDELRAFCNLVARRAPSGDALAWALGRFQLGCSRAHPYEGLTDHLLALHALLDPERTSEGLLAARIAALCAAPEQRRRTLERVLEAIALERAIAAGEASQHAGGFELARELGGWLKALLSDVICGHLDRDLQRLADELLLVDQQAPQRREPQRREPQRPAESPRERFAARRARAVAAPAELGADLELSAHQEDPLQTLAQGILPL